MRSRSHDSEECMDRWVSTPHHEVARTVEIYSTIQMTAFLSIAVALILCWLSSLFMSVLKPADVYYDTEDYSSS